MKEPILSREEAFKLAQRFEATEDNDNIPGVVALTPLELEQFVSAILEKLCGEPVAWMVLAANTGSPCEVTLHKIETEALRQDCVIPLYSIKEKHHG